MSTISSMESTDSVSQHSSENETKGSKELSEFSKKATALTLCYLMLIYYMDRFCIAGLLVDIQCIYQVGDDEGGYLQSAFILSFIVAAPIAGFLGDRYSRKYIVIAGMFFWSCVTLGASFVPEDSFWLFLTLRALTGIGEACFSTMAPGIISDLFVLDRRTRYLALYSFCIPMGSGLGFIVGSQVAQAAGSFRWGLRVTPVLGIIGFLLVIFLVQDPPRGLSEGSRLRATNWAEDFKYLGGNWTYISMVVATTSVAFIAGAFASWGPKFVAVGLVAEFGVDASVDIDTVSLIFGAVTIVASIFGVVAGSVMSQKLRGRFKTVDPLICAIGLTVGTPLFYCMMLFARGPQVRTYVLSFVGQLVFNLNWAISADISMYVIVPTRRATSKALQLLCNHILGDAGSPFVIGLVSEAIKPLLDSKHWTPREEVDCDATPIDPATADRDFTALQYALFIVLFVNVIATFAYFAATWTVVADKKRVDDAVKAEACGL